jgi:pantoate--beta-alanine ligase
MQKIETVSEIRSLAATFKSQGKSIALVPTQGALHAGQEVLIRAAAQKADVVIVSIFVNSCLPRKRRISTRVVLRPT